jgi:hypothetical protein
MISGLILFLELGLISLLLLLAFRVLSLTRSEPLAIAMPAETQSSIKPVSSQVPATPAGAHISKPPSWNGTKTAHYPDKCELISQLHILASLQVRDCKQQGLELEKAHTAVREYSVCWLYGAACTLGSPSKWNSEGLAVLVSQFASRKTGIRQPDALAVISTLTRYSASLACFRGGIEGAEFWKNHHFVPREQSLFGAVTSNAFV